MEHPTDGADPAERATTPGPGPVRGALDLGTSSDLAAMVDAAPDAMLYCELDGTIVLVNAMVEEVFGWSREDLIGRPVEQLVPPAQRDRHARHRGGYVEHPDKRAMSQRELRAQRKDGSTFPADVALAPVEVAGRTLVAATIRDVTRHHEQLNHMRDLDEMKNLFLSAVSHELRSPLTVVHGLAEMLTYRNDVLDSTTREEMSRRIVANTKRIQSLLNDLLDIERLRRGETIQETLRPTDVLQVVTTVVEAFRQEHEGPVELEVPDDVEPGSQITLSDPALLERVVENLLTNARKYAEGSPIEVTVVATDDHIGVEVEDHGPGIPASKRESIFRAFDRGDHDNSDLPGLGIGLTLVQRFTHAFGGMVDVGNRMDGQPGAHIAVWLRRAPPREVARHRDIARHRDQATDESTSRR